MAFKTGFDKGFLLVNEVGVLNDVWATFQSFFLCPFVVILVTFSKIQGSRIVIGT